MARISDLESIAAILRRDVLEMTTAAGSGHPSSCLSCAEIISTLFFSEMKYDPKKGFSQDNDVFVLSKGHVAPILYAALKRAGCIDQPLSGLRTLGSDLEGHPVPPLGGWVKVATGSLGQGLSVGVGSALGARMQKKASRVFVLLGDSECAEGSVWEAAQLASYYKTDNLCAVVDVNTLGQRGKTMLEDNVREYKKRFESFGWNALIVDGHSIKELMDAASQARKATGKPTIIIASTVKGKGVALMEGVNGWHGKALSHEELKSALETLPVQAMPKIIISKPSSKSSSVKTSALSLPVYSGGSYLATREAYGQTLAALAHADPRIVALDAEVSNSTFAELVKKETPQQFIECYIAEQNMIGMALGLSTRGYLPFASSFAAFLSRAHDQLRMGALSATPLVVSGSHAGVSIGQDGASQMGLEDIALFRSLPGSTVFYPSDAVSTQKILQQIHTLKGVSYIRTTRAPTSVIYSSDEEFPVGDFKIVRQNGHDQVVLIGAGITLHEALKSHVLLKKERISSAVVDLYCIKPLNKEKLIQFVREHGNRVIVVEDHYPEGGIGDAVSAALAETGIVVKRLAVSHIPHSGTKEELLSRAGIDTHAITAATINLLRPVTIDSTKLAAKVKHTKKRKK